MGGLRQQLGDTDFNNFIQLNDSYTIEKLREIM